MKKLLSIILLSVFVLAACAGSGTETESNNDSANRTVVCADEDVSLTLHSEDGVITSIVVEGTENISNMSEEEISLAIGMFEGLGGTYEMDGDYLNLSLELDVDQAMTFLEMPSTDLDEIIADAEENGATCN